MLDKEILIFLNSIMERGYAENYFLLFCYFVSFVCVFAQNIDSNNINPQEEIVIEHFLLQFDTSKTYTIEVRSVWK